MYHAIEFGRAVRAELEIPGELRLAQVTIKKGTHLRAQIRPYVVESKQGPIEMADLYLEDGNVAHAVSFASFRFVEE